MFQKDTPFRGAAVAEARGSNLRESLEAALERASSQNAFNILFILSFVACLALVMVLFG
jgi:hypothetical protein